VSLRARGEASRWTNVGPVGVRTGPAGAQARVNRRKTCARQKNRPRVTMALRSEPSYLVASCGEPQKNPGPRSSIGKASLLVLVVVRQGAGAREELISLPRYLRLGHPLQNKINIHCIPGPGHGQAPERNYQTRHFMGGQRNQNSSFWRETIPSPQTRPRSPDACATPATNYSHAYLGAN
jgi:hypothetical protein